MGSSVSAAVKAYSNKKIAQPQAETAQQVDVVEPTMEWSRLSTVDLSPATRGIQAKLNISAVRSKNSSLIQRQPKKGTGSSKADETQLVGKFKAITLAVDNIGPTDTSSKNKLRKGIKEFFIEFAKFKPEWTLFDVQDLPAGYGYDDWKQAKIFSRYEATTLAARLRLMGLDKESIQFYKFAKPYTTVGTYKHERPDTFFEQYTSAAIERVKLSSLSEMDESLDLLIKAFLYIVEEVSKLDVAEIKRDEKITSPILPAGYERGKLGWEGIWRFYLAQIHRLGQIFGGIQRIVQTAMENVFKELNNTGEAPTIAAVVKILKKLEKAVPAEKAFQKKVPASVRKKYGLPASGRIKFYPAQVGAAVTRSTFTKKGGKHLDVFDKSSGAASVDIEYYDKEREKGEEKYMSISMIHQARWKQVAFINEFYGLNDKGRRVGTKQSPRDLMSGQFSLFSLDDWRQFAYRKYDDLVTKQKANKADAFLTVIRLMRAYVQAFSLATPYNIAETGASYLTSPFPRALSGQLVQDCGVFALKTIYMLSLLADKINLKIQYVILPNHVGLIIKGDNTPLVIVHNNSFTPFALSESQFDGLSRQNQRMILSQGSLDRYLKARKQKNTLKFTFTLDKMKQSWTNATAQMGIPGPVTDKQFQGELAANYFVSNVDMPFTLRDVNSSLYQSSQSTGSIKKKLWKDYQAMVNSGKLFNDKAIAEEFTPNYQFNLRYLKLTQLDKKFHNEILVPYWNGKAHNQWRKLVKELKAASTAGDIKRYIEILTDYRQAFNTGSKGVISKYQFIQDEKDRIHRAIDANQPGPLKSCVGRTFGARGFGNIWKHAFNTHLRTLDERLAGLRNNKQTLAKGTDIKPAFANRGDLLKRQP